MSARPITAGPWERGEYVATPAFRDIPLHVAVFRPRDGLLIAVTGRAGDPKSEGDADLMAAAHELADAVRVLLAVCPVNWREDGEIAGARRIAMAALAKSEGRAQGLAR